MAGNNSIQILRSANLAASANKTQVPLAGQPLYDEATRRLYVGDGTATAENLSAIVASHSATTNRVTAYYGEVASNESAHSIDITSISGSPVRINSANMVDILGNLGLNIRTNMSHTNLNISATAANSNIYLRSGHTTVLMGGNILATDVSNVNISSSYFRVDASSGSNLTVSTDAVLNAARRLSLNGTYANIEASDAIFIQSFSPTAGMSNITLNGSSINIAGPSVRINGASGNYISIGGAISMCSYSTDIAGYQFNVNTSLTNINSSNVNIYSSNSVSIYGVRDLSLKKGIYTYSFPNYSGTVAMRSDIGEVIYSNSGRVLPNTPTHDAANAFSLISASNIHKYDQVLIRFKCSDRPNSSSLSSYFETSVIADRMGYIDDWGSFSVTPTFITCNYGNFSIFRSFCFIQFSYANGQILANQQSCSSSSSYRSYGMTFYANGNVATFNANNRANFWKVGITDIIGLVKNANYLNS